MGKVTVVESISLDGVMQAPGTDKEDTRGGFTRGGWAVPYNDAVMGAKMGEGMGGPGALLLGRRTYEQFFAFWPTQSDNPYTEVLDRTTKYVASRTLAEPLPWQNSALIEGDAIEAVPRLKRELDLDLTVLGSGELVRGLAAAGLVDRYLLLVHPLVLGSGTRLFEGGWNADLDLVESVTTTKGVVIGTYLPV